MKKILFTFLVFLASVLSMSAQKPFYVYLHDGTFRAFLSTEVNRIEVSRFDMNNIEHSNYVVQEFWTVDSVYRYPIADIDSIGFTTPKTEFKADATNIAESLEQYVISADDSHIYLKVNTPAYLIPTVGQKLAYPRISDLFPYGFSGKVEAINNRASDIEVSCQKVSLNEVFETFYCVIDSKAPNSTLKTKASSRANDANSQVYGITPIHIPSVKMNISDELSKVLDYNDEIRISSEEDATVELSSSYDVSLYIVLDKARGLEFQSSLSGRHTVKTSMNASGGLDFNEDFAFGSKSQKIELPYGFAFYYSPGAFLNASAKFTYGGQTTQKFTSEASFEYTNTGGGVVNTAVKIMHDDTEFSMLTALDGKLGIGAFLEAGITWGDTSVGMTAYHQELGVEVSGSSVFRNEDFSESWHDTGLYAKLKKAQVKLTPYMAMSDVACVGSWEDRLSMNRSAADLPVYTRDLVPSFFSTKITPMSTSSAQATTGVVGNCMQPVPVGFKLCVKSESNFLTIYEDMYAAQSYFNEEIWFNHEFGNLTTGETYTLYPQVKIFNYDVLATPPSVIYLAMPTIASVKETASQYSEEGFTNAGKKYKYKFDVATTVSIATTSGVADWGYVYKNANGELTHISLNAFETKQYTDNRYSYYSNESEMSICIYPYVKYIGDERKYYYGAQKYYTLTHSESDRSKMREYLVRLYNSTNGKNWKRNDNWCSDKPINEWYGVDAWDDFCSINLDDNNLVGYIDLKDFTELSDLSCNNNKLTSVTVSGCKKLKTLWLEDNNLNSLDASDCTYLQTLWFNQLENLNISGCTALNDIHSSKCQLTSLNASGCTALTSLWRIDFGCLKSLDVSGCTALTSLNCENNKLEKLDVSGCTALESLWCKNNQLTSLSVTGCTALTSLNCENNKLETLDVSGCTSLTYLSGFDSGCLESLNVSGCTALTRLNCENNKLEKLDVSGCTALESLRCLNNQLTSLNVTGCTALTSLSCENNKLETLDVSSGCTALDYINLGKNPLTSLNASGCTSLTRLYGFDSGCLESLNVSGCTSLETLSCSNNQLSTLNVSGCVSLKELYCKNNRLTSLNISDCTSLTYLACENNYINQVIDGIFAQIFCFSYDQKYLYYKLLNSVTNEYELHWVTREYGWWYPGEPERGYHDIIF